MACWFQLCSITVVLVITVGVSSLKPVTHSVECGTAWIEAR